MCATVGSRSGGHVGNGFSWNDWLADSLTGSLFATRQLSELRFTQSKIAEEDVRALTDYLAHPSPDHLVLKGMGKLEDQGAAHGARRDKKPPFFIHVTADVLKYF